MRYRPEIDGLRAISVLPVIMFHAGFTLFSGGFVGVDIFFVISGFLITSIIASEISQNNFTFLRFYERRARRILPALFFVIACCFPFAWLWTFPVQAKELSASVVSVVFFASNIFFWMKDGYFSEASELRPLLHTWSLAVEEQYYLLFPPFLLLLWRYGRNRLFLIISILALGSLLLTELGWRFKPSANFFLAPTRAWELLAGSLCALFAFNKQPLRNNFLSSFGLALIVFAILRYDNSTPFPSSYALAPVMGACLILLFGNTGTAVAWLLSRQVLVALGLISYSAYLWHQPVFAFARIHSIFPPNSLTMASLACLSLILAFITWKYVESPFRSKRSSFVRGTGAMFSVTAAFAVTFVCIGLAGYFTNGFPQRVPADAMISASAANDIGAFREACLNGPTIDEVEPMGACHLGVKGAKPDFIVWGDSYAAAIADGIDRAAEQANRAGVVIGLHSCPPLLKAGGWWTQTAARCADFQQEMPSIIDKLGVKTVILHAAWTALDKPQYIKSIDKDDEDGVAAFTSPLMKTLNALSSRGVKIVIIGSPPTPGVSLPNALAKLALWGDRSEFNIRKSQYLYDNRSALKLFTSAAVKQYVKFIDLADQFCKSDRCDLSHGRVPLFFDAGHLTKSASLELSPFLARAIFSPQNAEAPQTQTESPL